MHRTTPLMTFIHLVQQQEWRTFATFNGMNEWLAMERHQSKIRQKMGVARVRAKTKNVDEKLEPCELADLLAVLLTAAGRSAGSNRLE